MVGGNESSGELRHGFIALAPSFTGSAKDLATPQLIRTPRGRTRVVGGLTGDKAHAHSNVSFARVLVHRYSARLRSVPFYFALIYLVF